MVFCADAIAAEHRREDLVAVLQVLDAVAGQDRRAQQHRHLAHELRVGHRVVMLDAPLQLLLGRAEVLGDHHDQHRQRDRHQHGQDHLRPAPMLHGGMLRGPLQVAQGPRLAGATGRAA